MRYCALQRLVEADSQGLEPAGLDFLEILHPELHLRDGGSGSSAGSDRDLKGFDAVRGAVLCEDQQVVMRHQVQHFTHAVVRPQCCPLAACTPMRG